MREGDKSTEKAAQIVNLGPLEENLSPDAFHIYAGHYYKCKQDFKPPDDYFSPVPYFLLCRAIELEIKARHLKHRTQTEVKDRYFHNLMKAYNALDPQEQILTQSEEDILAAADEIYSKKGFEYFVPADALTAFSRYRSYLEPLDTIAKKLIDSGSTTWE